MPRLSMIKHTLQIWRLKLSFVAISLVDIGVINNFLVTQWYPKFQDIGFVKLSIMGMQPSVELNPPRYPVFSNYQARINTFVNWSNYVVQPNALAAAGFLYTGVDDHVRCYHCGGGLKKWLEGDNPWTEHRRWYPNCTHLLSYHNDLV